MKKSSLVFLILIFVISIYFLFMLSPVLYSGENRLNDSLAENINITGHRGAGGLAPENTLSAIKKGIDAGVQRIEIDVRQTKDNIVICMHDKTINRTTNGEGQVSKLTYNQIIKYSAGIKFSNKFENEKVPSLEQVMKLVAGKVTLVIEIKDGNELYPGIEKRVIDLIKKYQAKDWAIVHSFKDSVLLKIHGLDKEIILHKLLIADFPFFNLIYDGELRVTNLGFYQFVDEFSTFYPFTTKRLIEKVHSLNKKINVWTVNDSLKINRLINLGVDGIITDYPNLNTKF